MNNTLIKHANHVNLGDLFNSRLEHGFFSAESSPLGVLSLMEKIVDFLSVENQMVSTDVQSSSSNIRIGQIHWIDSAHIFNPGFVAHESLSQGLHPQRILRSIHVNQVYTSTQLQQAVRAIPRTQIWLSYQCDSPSHHPLPSLCEGGGRPASSLMRRRAVSRLHYVPLVIISDMAGLFHAESRDPQDESLFQEFLWQLSILGRSAFVLGLSKPNNNNSHIDTVIQRYAQPMSLISLPEPHAIAVNH